MAATLTLAPRPLSHARNQHPVEMTTSLLYTGQPGGFIVAMFDTGAGGPADGTFVRFQWRGRDVTMTAKTAPNYSGNQFRAFTTGENMPDYVREVATWMQLNGPLSEDFILTTPLIGDYAVYLTLRERKPTVLATSGNLTDSTLYKFDEVSAFTEPNLTADLRICEAVSGEVVVPMRAQYDYTTGKAVLQLQGAFDALAAQLPPGSSLPPSSSALAHGTTPAAHGAYYVRYADRYGTSPTPEALKKGSIFHVIAGGLAADQRGDFPYTSSLFKCHNYRRLDGSVFAKPVSPSQPDWVYIYSRADYSGCFVDFALTWSDGSATTYTPSGLNTLSLDLVENEMRWIQSGYGQCKLGNVAPASPGLEIVAYTWRLKSSGGTVLASAAYEVECDCRDWRLYMVMDNGLGGCESIWLKGKSTWKYETDRQEFRRTNWATTNLADGEIQLLPSEGTHKVEVSTGWHPRFYIEHLRQLLLGRTWLIDMAENRFIEVVLDTKSFDVAGDDQDLFELTFSFKYATPDVAFNLF